MFDAEHHVHRQVCSGWRQREMLLQGYCLPIDGKDRVEGQSVSVSAQLSFCRARPKWVDRSRTVEVVDQCDRLRVAGAVNIYPQPGRTGRKHAPFRFGVRQTATHDVQYPRTLQRRDIGRGYLGRNLARQRGQREGTQNDGGRIDASHRYLLNLLMQDRGRFDGATPGRHACGGLLPPHAPTSVVQQPTTWAAPSTNQRGRARSCRVRGSSGPSGFDPV